MEKYRIYGDLENQFVGFIQSKNIEEKTEKGALEAAQEALKERGIRAVKAVKVPKEKPMDVKNLGTCVSFLYSKDCDFGTELVAGMPTIIIYDQAQDDDYISLGFNDVEVAEEMLEKLVRVVEHFKK